MQHGVDAQISKQLQAILTQLWTDGYTAGLGTKPSTVVARVVTTAVSSLAAAWLMQIVRTTIKLTAAALVAGVVLASHLSDESRAKTIAKTEFDRAFNQARMDDMTSRGVTYIRWFTTSGNPCQACIDNEAAGKWPLGRPFPSGAMCPPDHPNCQCYIEEA